jgi:hypothetical protein
MLGISLRSSTRIYSQYLNTEQREELLKLIVCGQPSERGLPGSLNMTDYDGK